MLAQIQSQELDLIDRTLGAVEIGLRRHCGEEAHAAIDRHFTETPPLTWESSVAEIDELGQRIINTCQLHGIDTAKQLREAIWTGRFAALPNVGPKEMQRCVRALDAIGRLVRDWVI